MCREQSLPRYHDWCFNSIVKHILNTNNFKLSTHIFVGPLGLVPEDLVFFTVLTLEVKTLRTSYMLWLILVIKKTYLTLIIIIIIIKSNLL